MCWLVCFRSALITFPQLFKVSSEMMTATQMYYIKTLFCKIHRDGANDRNIFFKKPRGLSTNNCSSPWIAISIKNHFVYSVFLDRVQWLLAVLALSSIPGKQKGGVKGFWVNKYERNTHAHSWKCIYFVSQAKWIASFLHKHLHFQVTWIIFCISSPDSSCFFFCSKTHLLLNYFHQWKCHKSKFVSWYIEATFYGPDSGGRLRLKSYPHLALLSITGLASEYAWMGSGSCSVLSTLIGNC